MASPKAMTQRMDASLQGIVTASARRTPDIWVQEQYPRGRSQSRCPAVVAAVLKVGARMMTTLETPRLRLRPLVASDLLDLIRLDSDPEVMRYVGSPAGGR